MYFLWRCGVEIEHCIRENPSDHLSQTVSTMNEVDQRACWFGFRVVFRFVNHKQNWYRTSRAGARARQQIFDVRIRRIHFGRFRLAASISVYIGGGSVVMEQPWVERDGGSERRAGRPNRSRSWVRRMQSTCQGKAGWKILAENVFRWFVTISPDLIPRDCRFLAKHESTRARFQAAKWSSSPDAAAIDLHKDV